jgi:Rrf2 family protein
MKLSAQEEYGLRCLLQLARQELGASLTIEEISQAEGISYANVAKLLRILRQGGFVDSVRGQHGGYALARPAGQIAVAEVLALLGGPLFDSSFCEHYVGSEENCTHSLTSCSVRALWSRVQRAVDEVLKQTTLQDLIRQGYALQGSAVPARELLEIAG